MIDSFGFSDLEGSPRSQFLVEFFDDSYEDVKETVRSSMQALSKMRHLPILQPDDVICEVADLPAFATSTFVCSTGRRFTDKTQYTPPPEAAIDF
jgi:hypothetical protein